MVRRLSLRRMGLRSFGGDNSNALPPWRQVKNRIDGASPSVYADFGRDKYALANVGPNLVTNGDFGSGSTGWTTDAGVTISGGAAVFSGVAAGVGMYCTLSGIASGDIFSVTYTVASWTSGQVRASLETSRGATRAAVGGYNELIIATQANPRLFIQGVAGSNSFSVTGIIVRKLAASLGPELVQNGAFNTSLAGWDVSASSAPSTFAWSPSGGGQAVATTDGTNTARIRQTLTTIPGRVYVASIGNPGGVSLAVGTAAGASDLVNRQSGAQVFTAVATSTYISGSAVTNGLVFDGISVREVLVGLGPELVTNGGFDSDLSGWTDYSGAPATVTWSNGLMLFNTDGAASARRRQVVNTVVGRTYVLSGVTTGAAYLTCGTTSGGEHYVTAVNGVTSKAFVATTTTTHIGLFSITNGATADRISLREVLTNQPVQPVTFSELFTISSGAKTVVANDKTWKTVPANYPAFDYSSGKRQLLLEGAATTIAVRTLPITGWTTVGVGTPSVISTRGVLELVKLEEHAALGQHYIFAAPVAFVSGTTYVLSTCIEPDTARKVQLVANSTNFGPNVWATFDFTTGTVSEAGGSTLATYMTNVGGGVWRIEIVGTATVSASGTAAALVLVGSASGRLPSYTGTGAKCAVGAVQVEAGTRASSLIIAAGSQVTRVTDVCAFSPLLNLCIPQMAATMAWRGNVKTAVASQQLVGLFGWGLLRGATAVPAQLGVDGSSNANVALGSVIPGEIGAAFAWDTSGRSGAANGGATASLSSVVDKQMPPVFFAASTGMSVGAIHEIGAFVVWPLKGSNSNIQQQARAYA